MHARKLLVSGLVCCVVGMLVAAPPAQATPQAICVPWVPHDASQPHYTYSGAQITLKGIARGGATHYYWDYGDGGGTSWTAISNSYNLGVAHTYTGVPGQLFRAILHVKDGAGVEDFDDYWVQIFESSDLSIPAHLDVRINMAIDKGLWWLHTTMVRGTYGGGSPGYSQPYGYWNEPAYGFLVVATGTAVDAFQLHGSKVIGDYDNNPYVETVQRGMNYILCHTYDKGIGNQPAGNPDTNGNGIGLFINYRDVWNCTRSTYIGGVCALAVASSGAPNRIASVGGSYVYGREYREIVQDLVDYFAWGQVDSNYGQYRGGWRYHANYSSSDMSTTQWPCLAIMAAEDNMGSTTPAFVRSELPYFLNYVHHTSCDTYYGGWGYSTDSNHINALKAGIGIICHEFLGTPLTDTNIKGGLGYLYRHWNDNGSSWQDMPIHGNGYSMYAVMKAMRIPTPDMEEVVEYNNPPYDCTNQPTGNSFDWYYSPGSGSPQGDAQAYYKEGLAHYAVRKQHTDGSWDDTTGPPRVYDAFATGWQILTLQKGVTVLPPVADVANCDDLEFMWFHDIPLDGCGSHHPDPNRAIVKWEWDFEYDETIGFVADVTSTTECTTTIVDGYPWPPDEAWYPVALRVTDDNPLGAQTDMQVCQIHVHGPPHCPTADANGPYVGWVGVPVTLDGSGSTDPDNEIILYEWDIDNDGEFDDAVGMIVQWTWNEPYVGVIGLRVTDDIGEWGGVPLPVCSDVAYATVEIGNHAPVSDPNGPYSGYVGATITLDGTGSYDPDPGDCIASYAWDLDNDGEFDDSNAAQPDFQLGAVPGVTYTIGLKVTDMHGEYDIAYTTVDVLSQTPICDANGPYRVGCQGAVTTVALDGTGSCDPDGTPLDYAWVTDCPGGSFDNPAVATPTLSIDTSSSCSVTCNVTLTISDEAESVSCSSTVTILPDCNNNGISDDCDIDCGEPGGSCDVPGCGQSTDCDADGIPDDCQLADADCQPNGVYDPCDILYGTSEDANGNLIPDECNSTSTPPGDDVVVITPDAPEITITFDGVDEGGETTVEVEEGSPGPLDCGFQVCRVRNNVPDCGVFSEYYAIDTTATYTPPVKICLSYDDTGMTIIDEFRLKMFHFCGDGTSVDITVPPVNWRDNIVCGEATTLPCCNGGG
ncbi:MAG: hypothetical protein KAV82_06915 [Phycisphaerae bacterium]|nr:hypothetical protein [Phycisphaerae bacterium]